MPIYNLLEYSDNYSMTSGSLWDYYRNEKMMTRMKLITLVIDQPVKNKQEAFEKLVEISRNDGYLLNYLYHQSFYKLVGMDLSRQTNTSIAQKVIS